MAATGKCCSKPMSRSAADTTEKNLKEREPLLYELTTFSPGQRLLNSVLLRSYQQCLSISLSVGKKSEPKRVCKPKQPERVSTKVSSVASPSSNSQPLLSSWSTAAPLYFVTDATHCLIFL